MGILLAPLQKTGLPLIGNVHKPLAKSVLMSLGLIAAASLALITHAAIRIKMFGSGVTILIISNEEMNDIMKIVIPLEESHLFIKAISEIIKNETKEEKGSSRGMLLDTLGAKLLRDLLTGKRTIRAGDGEIRAGQDL